MMRSHQQRNTNSYGYYYLNAAYHHSSSSLSFSPSVYSPPKHVSNASATRINLLSRNYQQQLSTQYPKFKIYKASPFFEFPPNQATRRNLRTNIFLST